MESRGEGSKAGIGQEGTLKVKLLLLLCVQVLRTCEGLRGFGGYWDALDRAGERE